MASRERILIVDDTPDNILLLREILDDYTVLAAANGPEALEVAATDPQPDCILLDVLMPVMDGYEVCRRLKAQERTRHIPVLFVTTLHDTQDETRGLELGAVDYITKPVRPPVVRARVRNHLRLKAYQEHLEALVDQRTQGIVQTEHVAILTLAALAETRDNELGGHFQRTQHTARLLAEIWPPCRIIWTSSERPASTSCSIPCPCTTWARSASPTASCSNRAGSPRRNSQS